MKIWIDLINTPQVSFWIPFIKEFSHEKHDIFITCRDSGNTVDLLKLEKIQFQIIGKGAGNGKLQKISLFIQRLLKLYFFIRQNKPDVAASQSSFYQPVVSWALGIPCLYTNDNEHAKGNWFGFQFASKVLLPVALKDMKFTTNKKLKSKVSFYPSVKEAIYLSYQKNWFSSNGVERNIIYFRPEPWSAQYYKGPLNFFDNTLISLSDRNRIIILPRDEYQKSHYKQHKFFKIHVAEKPIAFKEIFENCKLFIGAGGSMTRELAVLGVPVISIYQESMLKVDDYLVERGLMSIKPDITFEEINSIINNDLIIENNNAVIDEGIKSFSIIKDLVINLKNEKYD